MDTTAAPQLIEHLNKSLTFTPFDTKWIPNSARFVLMGQHPRATGTIQVYELASGELKLLHEWEKPHGIKCGTFGATSIAQRQLAYGDYNGNLVICDLEHGQAAFSVQGHGSIINAIDGCGGLNIGGGAPELVTGGRDGCVRVWDPRQKEAVVSLEPAEGETPADCWTVAFGNSFNDEDRCICAGYDNGDVKLFDLRTMTLRWDTNVKNGVCGVEFDRKDIQMNKLLVATLESKFSIYDLRTFHPEEGYAGLTEKAHNSTVWLGRHLPQNRDVFMTCGGNGALNLYKYSYPSQRSVKDADGIARGVPGTVELLNQREVATQPIVSFDWHPDRLGLAVMAALDQTCRVFIVTKLNTL
eukprot:GILJ01004377.1.p1 GENE.GILJ01004377.1~~GILJ01004377.1.p1  ORF type:complete len:356 (-),score=39.31 GILJ01004377.1:30-1097(-)